MLSFKLNFPTRGTYSLIIVCRDRRVENCFYSEPFVKRLFLRIHTSTCNILRFSILFCVVAYICRKLVLVVNISHKCISRIRQVSQDILDTSLLSAFTFDLIVPRIFNLNLLRVSKTDILIGVWYWWLFPAFAVSSRWYIFMWGWENSYYNFLYSTYTIRIWRHIHLPYVHVSIFSDLILLSAQFLEWHSCADGL